MTTTFQGPRSGRAEARDGQGAGGSSLARLQGTWMDAEAVDSLDTEACRTPSHAEHLASGFLEFTPSPVHTCLVDAISFAQKIAPCSGKKEVCMKGRRSELPIPKGPRKACGIYSEYMNGSIPT